MLVHSELDGEWRADIVYLRTEPLRTDNVLAELNGRPARFAIGDSQIRLTFDCETLTARVQVGSLGELRAQGDLQREHRGVCSVSQANRNQVASLLSSSLTAERIPPSALYLEAGDVYAVLRRY